MLGLAVLFFLGLWVLITLCATRAGWKLGKKWGLAWLGALLAFMPLMGGWIIWWGIEYALNLKYAKEFCAETGIEIYVTPEEWKAMVGGEEAWKQMPYEYDGRPKASTEIPEILEHKGRKYKLFGKDNDRIYSYNFQQRKSHTGFSSLLRYDIVTKSVLFIKSESFTGSGYLGLKFWLTDIPECRSEKKTPIFNYVYHPKEEKK